jgi:O-antigen/teichoic acid export membrane protein
MQRPLYRWLNTNRIVLANAGSVMSSQVLTSGVGFVYWWLAARQFPPAAVGLASAAISAMMLLGTASVLGLGTLLIGELPRQPGRIGALLTGALCTVGVAGGGAGLLFAMLAPRLSPDLAPLAAGIGVMILFALGVALTAVTLVLDQALVGLLRGELQLWRNIFFAVAKLVLLAAAGLWLAGRGGLLIYATWVTGSLTSLLFLAVLAWRYGITLLGHRPAWGMLRGLGRSALGHHALNLTLQIPSLALPLVVTIELSATANAHFYVAWMIAGLLFVAPYALTTVLYAVGAADPETLAHKLRQSLLLSFGLCVAATLVLWVAADWMLAIFGQGYALEAGISLRLMALGVIPLVVRYHYIALARLRGRVHQAALLQACASGLELLCAATGAALGGLPGLSIGWLMAVTIEAIVMAPAVYRAGWQRPNNLPPPIGHPTGDKPDQALVGTVWVSSELESADVATSSKGT